MAKGSSVQSLARARIFFREFHRKIERTTAKAPLLVAALILAGLSACAGPRGASSGDATAQDDCSGNRAELCKVLSLKSTGSEYRFRSALGVAVGSGVVVTARHVVNECRSIKVLFGGAETAEPAELISEDQNYGADIALVKINGYPGLYSTGQPTAIARSPAEAKRLFLDDYSMVTLDPLIAPVGEQGHYNFAHYQAPVRLLALARLADDLKSSFLPAMSFPGQLDRMSFVSRSQVIWRGKLTADQTREAKSFNLLALEYDRDQITEIQNGQSGSPVFREDGSLFGILSGSPERQETRPGVPGIAFISPLLRSIDVVADHPEAAALIPAAMARMLDETINRRQNEIVRLYCMP